MLIYGNTPKDIVRIFRINRWKLIAIIFVITTALLAYDKFNRPAVELRALDAFWDALVTGKNSTGVE